MDVRYRPIVKVEMSRHDAKELLALVQTDKQMINGAKKRILKELKDGLKPEYHYQVQCYDCHKIIDVVSHKKMTFAQAIEGMDRGDGLGILCSSCLEDYK